ncbi:MAG: alpha/beta fold hydrolase [Paracoccaceae bacterium]
MSGNIAPERLDELIADNASDPAVSFDLLEQKAKMSAPAQAAELNVVRAALAERYPDLIQSDVVGIRIEAAEFYMKADLLEQALGQLYLAFDRLQDSSANHELMEAVLKNIASLEEKAGREEKARQLRGMIDALPATLDKPPASRSNDPGYAKIEVFYATDRARTGRSFPSRFYGHERADFLDYGVLNVTLPRTHVSGSIITPSIWKLEFSEDPTKHTMLQSVTPLDQKVFYSMAQQSLSDRGASDAFVFVHGYNVSFDTAAKRTAQIAYDMNFAGLPILYSWPSRGATTGYVPDSAVVRLSGRKLTHFLEDFAAKSGAKTVHLIGHSMGNRALTDALELLALRRAPVEVPIFDQVIFAAPDVDQGLFAAVVPTIKPIAKRLTLYASDQDLALRASQKLHGNAPRAGQAGEASLSHSEIDTIDMSGLGDDVLAHSYVANDESAMLDIATLFWRNADPSDRCGLNRHAEKLRVWLFVGAECANLTALSLVSTLRNEGAETRNQVRSVVRRDFQDARQTRAIEPLLLNLVSE